MTNHNNQRTYFGKDAIARIPKDKLYIMNILTRCFKDKLYELAHGNGLILSNKRDVYIFDHDRSCTKSVYIGICVGQNLKRDVTCGIIYWEKFYNPEYDNMFSIDMSIDSEITYMLDYSIWILEYIYRNDPAFFQKLFKDKEDRLVKWSRGTDVQYYYYFFFHSKELEFAKYMIKEILQWLFARKEIIEVLKGERWIKGYIPPTPY